MTTNTTKILTWRMFYKLSDEEWAKACAGKPWDWPAKE